IPPSTSNYGAGPGTLGNTQQSPRPWSATSWSLPHPQSANRPAAHLLGPPGQEPLPVLPCGLCCSRQCSRPLGGPASFITLRSCPRFSRHLSLTPEQRRGTRLRNLHLPKNAGTLHRHLGGREKRPELRILSRRKLLPSAVITPDGTLLSSVHLPPR